MPPGHNTCMHDVLAVSVVIDASRRYVGTPPIMSSGETSAAGSSAVKGTKGTRAIRLPRDAAWVAALRNVLSKYGRDTPAAISGAEAELDERLNELWARYACDDGDAPSSPFAKKIAELKSFYEQKLLEIARKEAEYTSQITDEETLSQDDPIVIKKAIKRSIESTARQRFGRLRLRVKEEVMKTIHTLRDRYADKSTTKRTLPHEATKAMSLWFEIHSSNPYPSDAEKEAFAAQFSITVTQVTTWFTNKRYRNQRQH